MGNNTEHKNTTWQVAALSVLCAILAVVLIVMIFGTAYVNKLLGNINRVPSNGTDGTQLVTPDDVDPDASGGITLDPNYTHNTIPFNPGDANREGIFNILLVGQDRRPNEGRQRSDSMMLCSFNTNTGEITMISFLRDTYVYIPGYGSEKLNAAYMHNGFTCLNQTLAVNFGVHVDANVEVDFEGFERIIDLLGGVEMYVTEKEAAHMSGFLETPTEPGLVNLTGKQALAYARIRKIDSDSQRTQRQRKVISALIEKYKNQSIPQMLSLLNEILPLITTDMSNDDIVNYAWTLFPMLSSATIKNQQIPASGTYQDGVTIGKLSWLKVADMDKNREILKGILENP